MIATSAERRCQRKIAHPPATTANSSASLVARWRWSDRSACCGQVVTISTPGRQAALQLRELRLHVAMDAARAFLPERRSLMPPAPCPRRRAPGDAAAHLGAELQRRHVRAGAPASPHGRHRHRAKVVQRGSRPTRTMYSASASSSTDPPFWPGCRARSVTATPGWSRRARPAGRVEHDLHLARLRRRRWPPRPAFGRQLAGCPAPRAKPVRSPAATRRCPARSWRRAPAGVPLAGAGPDGARARSARGRRTDQGVTEEGFSRRTVRAPGNASSVVVRRVVTRSHHLAAACRGRASDAQHGSVPSSNST